MWNLSPASLMRPSQPPIARNARTVVSAPPRMSMLPWIKSDQTTAFSPPYAVYAPANTARMVMPHTNGITNMAWRARPPEYSTVASATNT